MMMLSVLRVSGLVCGVSLLAACGGEPAEDASSGADSGAEVAQTAAVFRDSVCAEVAEPLAMPDVVSASLGQLKVAVVPAGVSQVAIVAQGEDIVVTASVLGDAQVIVEEQRSIVAFDVTGTGPTRVTYSSMDGFSCG